MIIKGTFTGKYTDSSGRKYDIIDLTRYRPIQLKQIVLSDKMRIEIYDERGINIVNINEYPDIAGATYEKIINFQQPLEGYFKFYIYGNNTGDGFSIHFDPIYLKKESLI